jgi:hypothetical protein
MTDPLPPPPSDLPPDPTTYFCAGPAIKKLDAPRPAPTSALKLLGPSPFPNSKFPLLGFLDSLYEYVATSAAADLPTAP